MRFDQGTLPSVGLRSRRRKQSARWPHPLLRRTVQKGATPRARVVADAKVWWYHHGVSVDPTPRSRTTALLEAAEETGETTLDRLLPIVYGELRKLAHRHLARERVGHTLCTTALVHEAYLRLVDDARVTKRGRAYFFAAAGRAMRQVLIDHARRRNADKRGGGRAGLALGEGSAAVDAFAIELLDLDAALAQLALASPRSKCLRAR